MIIYAYNFMLLKEEILNTEAETQLLK
jgi:hypothetical protein